MALRTRSRNKRTAPHMESTMNEYLKTTYYSMLYEDEERMDLRDERNERHLKNFLYEDHITIGI